MISYEEALAQVLAHARPLPARRVALRAARGCYLAGDVAAREPIPLFDQSSVDGYGVRAADLAGASETQPVSLTLTGEMRAGDGADCGLRIEDCGSTGGAIRIFTGAPIPSGVDTVVMKEYCAEDAAPDAPPPTAGAIQSAIVRVRRPAPLGANIRRQGEEFAAGTRVLAAGTRVTPPVIGLLATVGCARPRVHRKPRVALLATGNELREAGGRLRPGQIRDANTPALAAALEALGIEVVSAARVGDDPAVLQDALAAALQSAEVVVTAGGVSVGDYDYVKGAAAALGVRTVYWKVAIKPGMPNYFGILEGGKGQRTSERLLFGLPGNPVAALVSFHLFVRPALRAMAGAPEAGPQYLTATLAAACRKKPGRLEWVRGVLEAGEGSALAVTPTAGQESHMLGGLVAADCLIEFPAGREVLERCETVRVQLLEWDKP